MVKMKAKLGSKLQVECTHESGALIQTDAPKELGGEAKLFSPTDLFAVSVGACMLTIMKITAAKVGFDLSGATSEVEKEMTVSAPRRVARIIVRIRCPHAPSPQIREKLEAAALDCPVHRSIHPDVKQEIDFVWGL